MEGKEHEETFIMKLNVSDSSMEVVKKLFFHTDFSLFRLEQFNRYLWAPLLSVASQISTNFVFELGAFQCSSKHAMEICLF